MGHRGLRSAGCGEECQSAGADARPRAARRVQFVFPREADSARAGGISDGDIMQTPSDSEPGKSGDGQALTDTGATPPDPERPIEDGRRVSSGRGGAWISEAWRMFKDAPGSWVACFLIFVIIMIVLAIIPILGNIVGALISPFLVAGMMIGCREIERNEELQVAHLFAGFKENTGPLLVLGLLEFGLSLVAMLIAAGIILLTVGVVFLGVLAGQAPEAGTTLEPGFWIGALTMVLIVIALFIPVTMAAWFAPALVMLDKLEPLTALKWSFFACLKNMWPFLIYGIIMLVLAIVASIPFGLGWLVLGPVIIASVYTSYRDIFHARPQSAA
jgi:uncharacterized membrane protein